MTFLSRDSHLRQRGFPRIWSPITWRSNLGSRCDLEQSCSSCRELSNDIWHVVCIQVNWVDSWLFLVGSQIGNLTPSPSFDHNLCFKCLNEQCEPILDICVPRAFQWYKEHHKPLGFDPWNCSLKFWESTKTPLGLHLPTWELPWECECSLPHTPSHFLTFPRVCDVTPGLPLGSHLCDLFALTPGLPLGPHPCDLFALTPGLPLGSQPCNLFALVASPKLGLW
jgi:hypothetical protein